MMNPQTQTQKTNIVINMFQAENGFVININSQGAQKHFIAKGLDEAVTILSDFVNALKPNASTTTGS